MAEKPSFRTAFRKRRCLVLGDGYDEWHAEAGGKQPYFFSVRDDQPITFAGIWESWDGPDGVIETCAIIVTEANELSRPIHDRMPVMVPREACKLWLDHSVECAEVLKGLLRPYPAAEMTCYALPKTVGNPRNNGPELIVPISA